METLSTIDTMASDLLTKMPEILERGMEYGGDLFLRFQNYAITIESIKSIGGIVALIICVIILKKGIKNKEREIWDYDGEFLIMASITILFGALSIALIAWGLHGLITAMFLPEIYIINYFQ